MTQETGLDFRRRYTVASMPGIAFWVKGYATERTPEGWVLDCAGDEFHDIDGCTDQCWLYDEPEVAENPDRVIVVMVGDDRGHEVDRSELTPLADDGYCRDCGSTGCTSNAYE